MTRALQSPAQAAPERTGLFRAAWEVESLLLRRSPVVRIATPLLVLLVPLGSAGLVLLARSPRLAGAAAPKLAQYAGGDLASAVLNASSQVLSVAVLGAGGFVVAWAFGRELADGTAGGLFGLAVSRRTIALARCLLVLAWSVACVVAAVAVAVLVAVAASSWTAGAEPVDAGQLWSESARGLGAGVIAAGLAFPFAWVATATRSPLGTVGALIGVVALTQVVVVLGGGTWFPYAVPSLWTGMGGATAAAAVGPPQLALTAAVAPAAILAVVHAWHRLTDV
jgi:ABC-2 type transport system permease protein